MIKPSNLERLATPSGHIVRPRLLRQIQNCTRPVLWFTGPPGSGKSALARAYCESVEHLAIWHRLDESNQNVEALFMEVLRAARDSLLTGNLILPGISLNSSDASFSDFHNKTPNKIIELVHAIAEHHNAPWILCLDNYQLLQEGSDFHHIIVSLAAVAGSLDLMIIINSRTPPPAPWSSIVISRQIEVFSDFNFDLDEMTRIVATYPEFADRSDAWLQEIHDLVVGWPAGVTLILERLRLGLDAGLSLKTVGKNATSDYLKDSLFTTLAEDVKQLLLQSSLLPFLPVDRASEITKIPGAERIFDQLCNERLFTCREMRHFGASPDTDSSYMAYQHQALFRLFLRNEAEVALSANERTLVACNGAQVLAQYNEFVAAADLYVEYNRWDETSALILSNAPQLIESGQISQLEEVFTRLPDEIVDANPDLLFWWGVCEISLGQNSAREHLSKAYVLYRDQHNIFGMAISWRAVVDAIWLSWDGLDELAGWISEYDVCAAQEYKALPESMQIGLMMSRFGILSFWSPEHLELPQLERSVAKHVHAPMPVQEKALLFVKILHHFTYGTGNRSQTDFYLNVMHTLLEQEPASPLNQILLGNFEAAYQYCFVGSPEPCYTHVDAVLKIGEDSGVLIWQFVSLTHGLYMALGQGDIKRANKYFASYKQVTTMNNSMHAAFDEFFSGWLAMLAGKSASAMRHVDAGLDAIDRNPVPMIRTLFLGAKASMLIQQSDWGQAWSVLGEIRRFAHSARSNTFEIMVRLFQANWCLKRKRLWAARAFLQRARDIGVEQNIFVCPWLLPDQMPSLIGFALESDIDQAYFSRWVSLYSLKVPAGFCARDRWPWRVRIRTLGTLEIRLDDKLVTTRGRTHRRLLEILGILVTAGLRGLSQNELIYELWPDKSEEKGHSNLNTNLSRLRTFLGDPDAVMYSEGRVYINPQICLVDSWEFLSHAKTNGPVDINQLTVLENSYQGDYRVSASSNGAEVILRSTLSNRYLKIARSLATTLMEGNRFSEAVDIYRNMINKLGPDEDVYRGLMVCYAKMNRLQDVSVIFRECEKVLAEKHGTSPSHDLKCYYLELMDQS